MSIKIAPPPKVDETTPPLRKISWRLAHTSLNDGDHVIWLLRRLFGELSTRKQLSLMRHLAEDITRTETFLTRNDFNVMVYYLYQRRYLKRDKGLVRLLSMVDFTEKMPLADLQGLVQSITILVEDSLLAIKKRPTKK